jgi:hypothetical protein
MRWLLLLPLVAACDRLRPPPRAERTVDSVRTVVAVAPDTPPPVVAPPPAPDSTPVTAPDSTVASAAPDSVVAVAAPDSAVVRPTAFVIPARLAKLAPVPEDEPMEFDAEEFPVLPHVMHGDCEGGTCAGAFVAYACRPATLLASTEPDAPVAARIPEGELLQVRRDLHMVSAGIVVVKQDFALDWDEGRSDVIARADTVQLAEGDTVFVLRYLERGRWTWAYHGRLHDSGEFWSATTRTGAKRGESEYAVRRSLPTREEWWNVTRLDGTSGWWLHAVSGNRAEVEAHGELQPVGVVRTPDGCPAVKTRPPVARATAALSQRLDHR